MQTKSIPTLIVNAKLEVLKQRLQQYGTLIGSCWRGEVWTAFEEVWLVFPAVANSLGTLERFEQMKKEKRLLNFKPVESK